MLNPITNSVIKERFRQANENDAQYQENLIIQRANEQKNTLRQEHKDLGCLFYLFPISIPYKIWEYFQNKKKAEQVAKIENDTNVQIRNVYAEADRKTMQQIQRYESEVDAYHKKILNNSDNLKEMVDYVTMMFQRMISHADSGPHIKFIETDFIFEVRKTNISFNYQSSYTNPLDDYNFERQRYRDLHTDTECEGLAQALAKMTIKQMKCIYPPNSIAISVSHNDAIVTMHFKSANKNFVVPRDIV